MKASQRKPSTVRFFIYAVAFHVIVIAVLLLSWDYTRQPPPAAQAPTKIIEAVAVDQNKVEAEVDRIEKEEQRKREKEKEQQRKAQEALETAKKEREQEEQRIKKLKEEQLAIKKQQQEEQIRLKKAEEERKKEETAAKALAEKKRIEEEKKRVAEEKVKVEAEKKKKAEEEKRRAEEGKRLAEKKKQEAQRQKELEEALAAEEREADSAAQRQQDQSEIDRYTAAIVRSVENVFQTTAKGLRCVIFVRMIPGGDVVDARVVQSSGNATFDRQAEIAVRKAAPLPVPREPRLFQQYFREMKLEFEPRG